MIAAFSHRFGVRFEDDGLVRYGRGGEDNWPSVMQVDDMAKGILKRAGQPITDRHLKRIRKKVGVKTRRSKKKRKLKPGEEYERMICLLSGEEAKVAAAAAFSSAVSSKTLRYSCHINRSWLTE